MDIPSPNKPTSFHFQSPSLILGTSLPVRRSSLLLHILHIYFHHKLKMLSNVNLTWQQAFVSVLLMSSTVSANYHPRDMRRANKAVRVAAQEPENKFVERRIVDTKIVTVMSRGGKKVDEGKSSQMSTIHLVCTDIPSHKTKYSAFQLCLL